jgi:hypothetical protein
VRVVKAVAIAVAAVVLLVLALPVANWAYVKLASVDRDAYVRANERILNSLPVFPRARELARGSSGYQDNGDFGIFDKTTAADAAARGLRLASGRVNVRPRRAAVASSVEAVRSVSREAVHRRRKGEDLEARHRREADRVPVATTVGCAEENPPRRRT